VPHIIGRVVLVTVVTSLGLCGCAGVTVKPLTPTGTASGGEEGVRYYRPEPYLLVAALPPTPPSSAPGVNIPAPQNLPPPNGLGQESPVPQAPPDKKDKTTPKPKPSKPEPKPAPQAANWQGPDLNAPGASGGTSPKDDPTSPKKDDTGGSSPPPTPSSAADVSFSASTPQYTIRLVYLPDYSHPMAMSMHSGLFGTASFAPALQDGWMLTSLQASGDNKVAETLTAVGSIVSAIKGGGASTAGSGKDKAPGAPPSPSELTVRAVS
jgi:hypothetical protein